LCGFPAMPAIAVSQAMNVRLSRDAGKVVLAWTGDPDVLYQAQGATSLGSQANWQFIDAPTTSSFATSIKTRPSEFCRIGVFTNTDSYSTYAHYSVKTSTYADSPVQSL